MTIGTETGTLLPTPAAGLRGVRPVLLPAAVALVALGAWQAFVQIGGIPSVILPSPLSTLGTIAAHWDILLANAIPTTVESALGFAIATLAGVVLAIVLTYSTVAREALYPNLVFFQLIPKIALAPLFIIWLGIGTQSRVAFSVFIAFFPVVIATAAGLTSVDRGMLRLCRALNASETQVFMHVRFPAALPYMFSGMKVAVTLAIIGVIIGEFITAQAGLGYLIIFATARADTEVSMAAIVVLCVCGLLLYGLVALGEAVTRRIYSAEG